MTSTISPAELARKRDQGESPQIIDVRTPAEFREVHVPGVRNVPLDALKPEALQRELGDLNGAPLYVICRSGNRSDKACEQLARAGMTSVVSVDGGTLAWEAAGLPVERGRKAISLERQVRIAAGSIVFVGALLAFFVHPAWAIMSGFVGAGLVVAGITDTCGMGMMLARMPWNR